MADRSTSGRSPRRRRRSDGGSPFVAGLPVRRARGVAAADFLPASTARAILIQEDNDYTRGLLPSSLPSRATGAASPRSRTDEGGVGDRLRGRSSVGRPPASTSGATATIRGSMASTRPAGGVHHLGDQRRAFLRRAGRTAGASSPAAVSTSPAGRATWTHSSLPETLTCSRHLRSARLRRGARRHRRPRGRPRSGAEVVAGSALRGGGVMGELASTSAATAARLPAELQQVSRAEVHDRGARRLAGGGDAVSQPGDCSASCTGSGLLAVLISRDLKARYRGLLGYSVAAQPSCCAVTVAFYVIGARPATCLPLLLFAWLPRGCSPPSPPRLGRGPRRQRAAR
jgi:hypothetical protein